MIQILWHGRGGQGAFTAARLLGTAWVLRGSYALVFPSFGPERRGAPVRAFTKLDTKPVVDRSEIKHPDFIIDLINPPAEIAELAERMNFPALNTLMLGRLARELGLETEYVKSAIELVMPEKLWRKNFEAVERISGCTA
ncbi:MAG: 2-oxoacid:acceptor oxidoreductase family protein [Synergistaceae bacterium]|jgi:pyruvate ferredoxin oxidoreductase gamma subunit|nr:2-oxoacid:acceptor oxidoreductase family protein [Synergistaceae bacterium]